MAKYLINITNVSATPSGGFVVRVKTVGFPKGADLPVTLMPIKDGEKGFRYWEWVCPLVDADGEVLAVFPGVHEYGDYRVGIIKTIGHLPKIRSVLIHYENEVVDIIPLNI